MDPPADDVEVLLDYRRDVDGDSLIRVRVLSVPESPKFPDGVKYRMHFGRTDGSMMLRYDNSHGTHERHTADTVEAIEFPGLKALYERFQTEVERMR